MQQQQKDIVKTFRFHYDNNNEDIFAYIRLLELIDNDKVKEALINTNNNNGMRTISTQAIKEHFKPEELMSNYFIMQFKYLTDNGFIKDFPRLYHYNKLQSENDEEIQLFWNFYQATFHFEYTFPLNSYLTLYIEKCEYKMFCKNEETYSTTIYITYPDNREEPSKIVNYCYIVKDSYSKKEIQRFEYTKEFKFTFKDRDSPYIVLNSQIEIYDSMNTYKINDSLYSLNVINEKQIMVLSSYFIEKVLFFNPDDQKQFDELNKTNIESFLIEVQLSYLNKTAVIDSIKFLLAEDIDALGVYKLSYYMKLFDIKEEELMVFMID